MFCPRLVVALLRYRVVVRNPTNAAAQKKFHVPKIKVLVRKIATVRGGLYAKPNAEPLMQGEGGRVAVALMMEVT